MKRLLLALLVGLFIVGCGSTSNQRPVVSAREETFAPHTAAAPVVGEVLTTTNGTWTNNPTSFTYQWQRCTTTCTNISGATTSSYTVQTADVGDTIDVIVTATNAGGSASQTSLPTGVVTQPTGGSTLPANTVAPSLSFADQVGTAITINPGTWVNSPTFSYQWQQCTWYGTACANISGATGSSYTPVAGNAGHRIQAIVIATNSIGSAVAIPLQATQVIQAAAYRTFYISYTNGSNSNNGTSTATPWKEAPGMVGFNGSYSPEAGDHFIFEGGDTWPASVMPLTVEESGTATAPYYYGVGNRSWFIGSSWTQPTFNAQDNTSVHDMFEMDGGSYLEVDGIHFTDFAWTGAPGWNGADMIDATGTTEVSVTGSLFDNWLGENPSGCSSGSCDVGTAVQADNNHYILIENNQCDQTATLTSADNAGACFYDGNQIDLNNVLFNVENAIETNDWGIVGGNTIYNVAQNLDYDSTQHTNAIEIYGSPAVIYDNLVYNVEFNTFSIDWQAANTDYIYGNVVYGTASRTTLTLDCSQGGCQSGTDYIFNNTLDGPSTACMEVVNRGSGEDVYGTVYEENNHCVGSMNSIDSGASITNLTSTDNLVQTPTAATADGYTTSNLFAPTSSSSPTVGAGTNLSSYCSGDEQWLCYGGLLGTAQSDTTLGGSVRPGSGAWDIGSYEYAP